MAGGFGMGAFGMGAVVAAAWAFGLGNWIAPDSAARARAFILSLFSCFSACSVRSVAARALKMEAVLSGGGPGGGAGGV